jgi:hypothetical protein
MPQQENPEMDLSRPEDDGMPQQENPEMDLSRPEDDGMQQQENPEMGSPGPEGDGMQQQENPEMGSPGPEGDGESIDVNEQDDENHNTNLQIPTIYTITTNQFTNNLPIVTWATKSQMFCGL